MKALCSFLILISTLGAVAAQDVVTTSLEDVGVALKRGETVVVKNGTYRDVELEWSANGTESSPVFVRAETPGGVIISGKSSLEIDGSFVNVSGFEFSDGYAKGKELVNLRGTKNSLTNCAFIECNKPGDSDDKWLALRGESHRVVDCSFVGKSSPSVILTVWRADGKPDRHVVERCHFRERSQVDGNGYETIRIGTSDTWTTDSFTVIRENLFTACDGEMEIISVKSGKNLIERNTFLECAGTVTLRHGNGTVVTQNIFAGKLKKETGGVRVTGEDHVVSGNAFIGTTARAEGAIALLCADRAPDPNGHQVVKNVTVENNLLVANKGYAIVLDGENGKRPILPENVIVRNNVMSSEDVENLVRGLDHADEMKLSWSENQIFRNNQVPREFTEAIPKPLTSKDVGATWMRD